RARRAPSELGSDAQRRIPRPNGRSGQAEWTARRVLHDRDRALPVPGRLPGDAAHARTPVATAAARAEIGPPRQRRELRGFGDRAIHPAHQVTELLAGDLDRVLGVALAQLLELLIAALHVGDQLLDERAVLNLG